MSIQATHGNPALHQVQSNRQPPPASHQSTPASPVPQDKVTISPEAKAKAAAIGTEHDGRAK